MDAGRVQLALVDVDGCLTPGEGRGWNWRAMETIAQLNQRSRHDARVPAVTLCTGRQEPYVEVLMQAIDATYPAVYENGCGLYYPQSYRFQEHPAINAQVREALLRAATRLRRQVVEPGLGYFQPGKQVSLTLYPLPGTSLVTLHQIVSDILGAAGGHLAVHASVSCVDVTPAGIDKGTGVQWLSEETGIPLGAIGGIGDSISDLAFLRLVGRSAAPANAATEVKDLVGMVASMPNGDGVVEILGRWHGDEGRGTG